MLLSHNGLCRWARSYGNGAVTGEIPEVADIPEGSIVNVFSNNGMQGEDPILRGTVGSDGRFTISGLEPLLISNVTVTVTHINAESISEFALVEANRFLAIACADAGVPGEQTGPFSGGDIGVCPLIVEAFVGSIHVIDIAFKADDGTLLDRTEIDGDGEVTEADTLLPGPVPFDEDGGSVVLVPGFILDPGSPQFWIIVYKTSVAVTDGTSFGLEVFSAAAETAEHVSPVGVRAVVSSTFPVSSDTFTVGPVVDMDTIDDWCEENFAGNLNNDAISGELADPDMDGLLNIVEYILGTDPDTIDYTEIVDNLDGTETMRVITTLDAR